MPTKDELTTLRGLATWDDTKKGLECTSKVYSLNSVFLPAAGQYSSGSGKVRDDGTIGCYWSSTHRASTIEYRLLFSTGSPSVDSGRREYGCSVRAVLVE